MVDCSVSTAPEAFLRRKARRLKMEDLLECPLCFEQLDVTAKVLPCQHTFCMSCLQRQETSDSQLLCPECCAPVPARTVEELPANLLLVRLLEGLQGSQRSSKDRQTARYAVPLAVGGREGQQQQKSQQREREKQGHNEVSTRPQPYSYPDEAILICEIMWWVFDSIEVRLHSLLTARRYYCFTKSSTLICYPKGFLSETTDWFAQ